VQNVVVWQEVTDALLAGITHELNGRVSAITGLLTVVAMGTAAGEALALLVQEGERLDAAVALLRGYPRGTRRHEEAIDPRELLEGLVVLHRQREDVTELSFGVEVRPGTSAARAERTWLSRALLVLLARASLAVRGAGGADVLAYAAGDASGVALGVRGPGLEGVSAADAYLVTAGDYAGRAGGQLRDWEIRLPTP